MLGIFPKRPVDQLDYPIDFTRWLADGDTVKSATTRVEPADSMVSAVKTEPTPYGVTVWLIDGEPGKTASIIVTATTTQQRVKQIKFQIRVRD